MSYFEVFPYLSLSWGMLGLFVSIKGEQYQGAIKLWLILAWGYLIACVPLFRDGQFIAESMQFFYAMIAIILSLEVWLIFIGALVAIALAKQAHDPEYSGFILKYQPSLRRAFKPMLLLFSVAHLTNSLYFVFR
ncbi:MAG: hypothetical protein HRU24_13800 [Gammaproteobacteria bacterium]|nr:hypothetical protein [Gammaproteobacteria bacterium]